MVAYIESSIYQNGFKLGIEIILNYPGAGD